MNDTEITESRNAQQAKCEFCKKPLNRRDYVIVKEDQGNIVYFHYEKICYKEFNNKKNNIFVRV